MDDVASSFETSAAYRIKQRYISEDQRFHSHHCQNLKSNLSLANRSFISLLWRQRNGNILEEPLTGD
jgi:hypothetical protein